MERCSFIFVVSSLNRGLAGGSQECTARQRVLVTPLGTTTTAQIACCQNVQTTNTAAASSFLATEFLAEHVFKTPVSTPSAIECSPTLPVFFSRRYPS